MSAECGTLGVSLLLLTPILGAILPRIRVHAFSALPPKSACRRGPEELPCGRLAHAARAALSEGLLHGSFHSGTGRNVAELHQLRYGSKEREQCPTAGARSCGSEREATRYSHSGGLRRSRNLYSARADSREPAGVNHHTYFATIRSQGFRPHLRPLETPPQPLGTPGCLRTSANSCGALAVPAPYP